MKTLFYHAERYNLFYGKNPLLRARVCGGRERIPDILTLEDIGILAPALEFREYVMVGTDVTTGLRESELFGLQWRDIDFANLRIKINRSIVKQRVGLCKTDRSHSTAPLDPEIAELLCEWRAQAKYAGESDWVFASSHSQGKKPYWGAQIMRKKIKPLAQKLGIPRLEGWHTFRHTYSSMLTHNGTNLKVVQELMRHRTIRTTMDTYTHATTPEKREAQTELVKKLRLPKRKE